jgi:hypothetical protein
VGTRWPGHVAMGRRGPLASGPCRFYDFSHDFSSSKCFKCKMVTLPLFKILQILHKDSLIHKEQLLFLSQLQIPSGLQVKNSGTNSILKLPRILKGFKPF